MVAMPWGFFVGQNQGLIHLSPSLCHENHNQHHQSYGGNRHSFFRHCKPRKEKPKHKRRRS